MTNSTDAKSLKTSYSMIASYIQEAVSHCYGVKAFADIHLMKGKKDKGIKIDFNADKTFTVDVYLVVAYGLKITETIRSCQKLIKFTLNHYYPQACQRINVYAYDMAL